MNRDLLSILTCPKCKSPLHLEEDESSETRIKQGILICQGCAAKFAVIDDIACFRSLSCKDKNKARLRKILNFITKQELKNKWLKNFNPRELAYLKKEIKWMTRQLILSESGIHLDWASGTGRFLRNILDKSRGKVIALEIDYASAVGLKILLQRLGKYSKVSIICADARCMPFADQSIDSVSSWHGLDEPNIHAGVKESQRVLKRSGRLVLSGLVYEKNSTSLKLAQKYKIEFAASNIIVGYLRRLKFRNINYQTFFSSPELSRKNFLPRFGDIYTSYAVSGKK